MRWNMKDVLIPRSDRRVSQSLAKSGFLGDIKEGQLVSPSESAPGRGLSCIHL